MGSPFACHPGGGVHRARGAAAGLLLLVTACAGTSEAPRDDPAPATASEQPSVPEDPPPSEAPAPPAAAVHPATPVEIAYRVEVRTPDPAVAGFPAVVESVLADPRGWSRAGFTFTRQDDAPHVIVLAEGPEVDALCLPYDTYGQYSCQNGPVVALNADRWRDATPEWTGDLDAYRVMLVNHEVGHLLGQRHTDCPGPGEPAPVMVQQSTELQGCLPNPWPLPDEVELAARRDQPIAPRYGE